MAWIARTLLRLFGWRVDVAPLPGPRGVIIFYPHTSNWDFVVGYLAKTAAGLDAQFLGKHTIFRWPIGGLLRWMGGIPVDRRAPGGIIGDLTRRLQEQPRLWLALAPEGTRKYTDHWKSGFYRLAVDAGVPLGLSFADYRARLVGLRDFLTLTGDEERDLARIRACYEGKVGKHPAQASDIRLHPPGTEAGLGPQAV
jgi:1-acyl-sn-glycerol-3-phosphate acyltransferase